MYRTLIVFILLILLQVPAWSSDLHVYTEISGISAFYERGALTGSGVEMVREIMRRSGDGVDIEVVPWMRGYDAALHDPNTVLFSTTMTDERKSLFHWVGPIIRAQWQFISQKGRGGEVNCLDDARKVKAIGTYLGDARDQYLTKHGFTNLDRATDQFAGYRKLAEGRLDLVLGTNSGVQAAIRDAGLNPDQFEVAYVLRERLLYIAISKQSDPGLVKRWEKAFLSMRKDGTFQRIFKKWYPNMEPPLQ